jgi:hypothetical protein
MGREVECAARVEGAADRGKALLETDEVIFRGARLRARVTFASIRDVATEGEWLTIAHAKGRLDLALGKQAAAWREKITKPKSAVEKLGIKAGAKVALVGLDDAALAKDLEALGASVTSGTPRGKVDVVIFGAHAEGDLAKVAPLAKKIEDDGALWIVRPKGKGGVAEAAVRAAGKGAGLVDVKVARFSETHTAEKLVVPVAQRGGR